MMRHRTTYAVAAALVATLAVAGCKKQEPAQEAATPAPTADEPAPTLEPAAPATPAAASVSVSGVELGTSVGDDMHVESPATTFAKNDTIIAAVSTATGDPNAAVSGQLGIKWTFGGDTTVKEETKDVDFTGKGVTTFEVSKPDGWPTGKYRVEVLLNGEVAQSREFEVQ